MLFRAWVTGKNCCPHLSCSMKICLYLNLFPYE
ncbi:hypothetical protein [uncultured Draconibacterium sp.]